MIGWVADALIVSGLALGTYGTWLYFQPLGYMVGGAALAGVGFLIARGSK